MLFPDPVTAQPVLEELPKWRALKDILAEVQQERIKLKPLGDTLPTEAREVEPDNKLAPIVVVCKELYMSLQLKQAIAGTANVPLVHNTYPSRCFCPFASILAQEVFLSTILTHQQL